jgi:hypothetical protein
VSSGAAPATTAVAEASLETAIQIDVGGRCDAVALLELLIPFHSFLVQHTSERWVVHARTPGRHGESLADALDVIEEWQAKQGVNASVRVAGHPQRMTETTTVTTVAAPARRKRWNA